ncbi:16280_t:CDS:2, partial [Funneliformis geosporum]
PSPFWVQTKTKENSLPARSDLEIMVFCIVLGDNTETAFPITLPIDKKQVSISDENVERMKILNTKPSSDIKIEELGGNVMSSRKKIQFYFPEDSVDEPIYIIIVWLQLPATTGKRRLEEDKEGGSRKRGKSDYPLESKEGHDSLISISGNRLDEIIKFVEMNRVGLLRSPPSSGKTTLGQTLQDYFSNCGSFYISLAGLGSRKQITEEYFENFWRNEVGCSWTEISDNTGTIYVFIDEIQVICGNRADYFWAEGELKDLTRFYVRMRVLGGNPLFKIPQKIADAIFSLTGGHVGLCRFILDLLYTHYKDKSNYFLAEKNDEALIIGMLRYLASPSLTINVMKGSRAFYWIDNWNPTEEEAKFIQNVLLNNQASRSFPVDFSTDSVAKNFVRIGLFVTDSGQVQFTAPIFRVVMSHHLFTSPLIK